MKKYRSRILPVIAAALILFALCPPASAGAPAQGSAPAQAGVGSMGVLGNEFWEEGFTVPGVNGAVLAIARANDGTMYVGGTFTSAGGVLARGIAWWDGSRWNTIEGGFPGVDGDVNAMVYDSASDRLYIGGTFTSVGGVPASNLAYYDGTYWHPLSGGTDYRVNALELDAANHMLYVGGRFSKAGTVATGSIAGYNLNTNTWQALGSGINLEVRALEVANGVIYAAGEFSMAGGVPAAYIASYTTGGGWAAMGDGFDDYVNALQYVNGSLYAGGEFTHSGANSISYLARWTGSAWAAVGSGTNGPVKALDGFSTSVFVGGRFTQVGSGSGAVGAGGIAIWSIGSSTWAALGAGVDGTVRAIYVYNTPKPLMVRHILIGGDFASAEATQAAGIADYSGSHWNRFSDPTGPGAMLKGHYENIMALARDSHGNLYAASCPTDQASGSMYGKIDRWDGTRWAFFARPNSDYGCIQSMVFGPGDVLYAAGSYYTDPASTSGRVYRWDGESWAELGDLGARIYTLAVNASGTLFAGGKFLKADGDSYDGVARWNGTAWAQVGSGVKGTVNALAVDPVTGNLYAAGDFTTTGDGPANNIARFDTTWHALGAGTDSNIFTLVADSQGRIYAGGLFTKANNVTRNHIAYWQNGAWYGMGTGADKYIGSLALDGGGRLYAAGDFTNIGGINTVGVARWNGAQWTALGSGIHSELGSAYYSMDAMAADEKFGMYFGGSFAQAGPHVSVNIAHWNDSSSVYLPSLSK